MSSFDYYDESLYDAILAAGVRSPGVVTLSGHDRVIGWDVKEGPGQSGASMTRKGAKPVEFTATFYLVSDQSIGVDQVADWWAFQEVLESTVSGSKPKPIDIYHPDLAARGITSVVLSSLGGVVHDGKGGQTIAVKLIEYFPPKPSGGTATGSRNKKPTIPDPDAEAKAELAALTKKYEATPWG